MDVANNDLLRGLPIDGKDYSYASVAADLCWEDIPRERIPKIRELMQGEDEFLALEAAKVLASWGEDEGFDFLERFVCDREPLRENWFPHRYRGYDDTYKHILDALRSYWATKATHDYEDRTAGEGDKARKKLLRPVLRIFGLSNHMQFGIDYFFNLIEDEGFTEYIPALKAHLEAILKNPKFHHWKVADCAHLLMKFDPEFVTQALAKHGKTLADYPNK
jgi:hypothetical protein